MSDTTKAPSMSPGRETVAEQWFRRVWRNRDAAAIDELFATDGVAYGIYGEVIKGPAEFRVFHKGFLSVFSTVDISVVEEIAVGNRVAIQVVAQLVHTATKDATTLNGTGFMTVRNGQIHEAVNCWDFLGLLESMKLMPPRSLELALAGKLAAHPDVPRPSGS